VRRPPQQKLPTPGTLWVRHYGVRAQATGGGLAHAGGQNTIEGPKSIAERGAAVSGRSFHQVECQKSV
jgi:hypothetical protein